MSYGTNRPMSAYELHKEMEIHKESIGRTDDELHAVRRQYCGQVRCSIYVRKASAKADLRRAREKTTSERLKAVRLDKERRKGMQESAEDTLDTMAFACSFQCKGTAEHYANWLRLNGYEGLMPEKYSGLGVKVAEASSDGDPDGQAAAKKEKKRKKKKTGRFGSQREEDLDPNSKEYFLMADRDPEDVSF